ncbi:unnamed protein product [marine sediment metagenome]|uniref:Uncharacterized protein n=1 Tax=marine sediment metagenome TaxID=412755 RepID=X1N2V9_9ZZZZ
MPKAQQFEEAGYWVVTYPEEVRPLLHTKKALARQAKKLRDVLRELGYHRGLQRWHYFGEQSHKYHPHQNALVEGGYLEPAQLERQKDIIRKALFSATLSHATGKQLDIHYSYLKDPKQIFHKLKYITRATFLDELWNEALAHRLYRFRNCNTWGTWDSPAAWELPSQAEKLKPLLQLAENRCPVCGTPLNWNKRLFPLVLVLLENPTEIAKGIYLLPPIPERPP